METYRNEKQQRESATDLSHPQAEYRYEDDTVSLIDLIAVLVRHRMMIVVGTILVGIVTATALYIGPMVGLEIGPEPEYTARRQMLVENVPQRIRQHIDFDPAVRLQSILNDPGFIGEVYAPFEADPPADRIQERYLAMIRRDIIGNAYRVEWNAGTRLLTLRYTASTPEDATAFIEAVASRSTLELDAHIRPQLDDAKAMLERTLDESRIRIVQLIEQAMLRMTATPPEERANEMISHLESDGGVASSAFIVAIGDITAMEELLERNHRFTALLDGTVVFEESPGSRSTIVIIATIAAFLVVVFLAFLFEYARRVRQEPEEMQKLQSAWRRE